MENNMNLLFLIAQGALIGYTAGVAFPDWGWEFFATILANSTLVVLYGMTKSKQ
jgi:hypothetical protein